MKTTFFIARRYLFAKKSHNVINIISIISAVGIAIGCAALVIILSIYNGFDSLIKSMYDNTTPDLVITPSKGKVFTPSGGNFDAIRGRADIVSFQEVLSENLFVTYGNREGVTVAIGVDSSYQRYAPLEEYIVSGAFELRYGSIKQAIVSKALSRELGVNLKFLDPLCLYFPSRTKEVSLLDALSSVHQSKLFPSGVIDCEFNGQSSYMFVPIDILRQLLEYDDQVTSVELRFAKSPSKQVQREIEELLGDGYVVKNRYQQNEALFKLMTYEKLAVYLILIFVVLIISCNVFGSLMMLVIDKRDDIEILKSMGADSAMIKRIFSTEGWLISLLGVVSGILLGLIIALAQQHFGLVKMPGNFMVDAYPVVVKFSDIVLTFVSVSTIGYIMSRIPKV